MFVSHYRIFIKNNHSKKCYFRGTLEFKFYKKISHLDETLKDNHEEWYCNS